MVFILGMNDGFRAGAEKPSAPDARPRFLRLGKIPGAMPARLKEMATLLEPSI